MFFEPKNVMGRKESALFIEQEPSGLEKEGGIGHSIREEVGIGMREEDIVDILKDGSENG